MPRELPALAGFTNTGKPNSEIFFKIFCLSFFHCESRMVTKSPTGNPAVFNKVFEVVLSIPIADPKTPDPTKAMACKSISP